MMTNTTRWPMVLALMGALFVVLACRTVTGTAVLTSRAGPGQTANLSFNVLCEGTQVTARFTLDDRPVGIAFDGLMLIPVDTCDNQPSLTSGARTGTYTPIPASRGPGGSFVLSGQDVGARGPS